MEPDRYQETWQTYRRARQVLFAVTGASVVAIIARMGHQLETGLIWLALAPFSFWSVWTLENLRCPRCGQKFINLLKAWPKDHHACPSCGLRHGATGDGT